MRLRRIVSQTKFETVSVLRNGEQLLLSIIFPLGLLIFLAETPLLAGLDIIDSTADPLNIAVAGALSLSLASSAFTGQAIATAFDRRYGVLAHPGEWGTVVSYLPSGALGDVMRSAIGVGGIDIKAIIVLLIWGLVGTLAARRWFRFE